jgi:hypothetical protein
MARQTEVRRLTVSRCCVSPIKLETVRSFPLLVLLFCSPGINPATSGGQAASGPASAADAQAPSQQALVQRALAAELRAAQTHDHPMRFLLRKTSPRLTTTKDILETKDGLVARLVSINDKPLTAEDMEKEEARLNALLTDPSLQQHRRQSEDQDTGRALKVLRALPRAFLFEYEGTGASGAVEKFRFHSNPDFSPPDLESQVLTQMSGELWVDPVHERVTHLDGHLIQDVDFGWGILGRLNKGGWISIDQSEVGENQWRVVHFKMGMTGRVLFKNRSFDTTEDESRFEPLNIGLDYRKAIEMLRSAPAIPPRGGR